MHQSAHALRARLANRYALRQRFMHGDRAHKQNMRHICATIVLMAIASSLTFSAETDLKISIEDQMAQWLAHPQEFGVRPKNVHLKRTFHAELITYGKVDIHLVEYTMPNGTAGRGFVNGGLTWSFYGPEIDLIKDDDLFVAYCGWAWLFPPLQDGTVKSVFKSSSEEAKYLAKKSKEGFSGIKVTERYKIGASEIFGFRAMKGGVEMAGAGNTDSEVVFPKSDPRFALPSVYFLLGTEVLQSVR